MKASKLFNRSFIVRKRVSKTRYGLSSGECFNGIHFHKYSFYFENGKRHRTVGFSAIKDIA